MGDKSTNKEFSEGTVKTGWSPPLHGETEVQPDGVLGEKKKTEFRIGRQEIKIPLSLKARGGEKKTG